MQYNYWGAPQHGLGGFNQSTPQHEEHFQNSFVGPGNFSGAAQYGMDGIYPLQSISQAEEGFGNSVAGFESPLFSPVSAEASEDITSGGVFPNQSMSMAPPEDTIRNLYVGSEDVLRAIQHDFDSVHAEQSTSQPEEDSEHLLADVKLPLASSSVVEVPSVEAMEDVPISDIHPMESMSMSEFGEDSVNFFAELSAMEMENGFWDGEVGQELNG